MVQSKALTVDAFLDEVSEDRRPVLERFRQLCLQELTGWDEVMAYGMPGYGPPGAATPMLSFNGQKQYIALYAGRGAIQQMGDRLKGLDLGGGCIRFRKIADIDFELVRDILKDVRTRKGAVG